MFVIRETLKQFVMKKKTYLFGYSLLVIATISLQSCNDDPIIPNDGSGSDADTTWVTDSTSNGGGSDSTYCDNGGGTETDSSGWDSNSDSTICIGGDSTTWTPIDSTLFGG